MFDSYNVHVLCQVGSRKLLFVVGTDASTSICVYDEHTSTTLMRMCESSLEELERAIEMLKDE